MELNQPRFDSETEFIAIMDPLPILVRSYSETMGMYYFNATWKQFAGDFTSWSDRIHPDFRSEVDKLFLSHSESRTAFKTKYRFIGIGGAYEWLAEQSVPWYSPNGIFLGFICYALEIDELVDVVIERGDVEALQREQVLNEELETFNEELNVSNEELQRSQAELSQAKNNLEQILNMLPASVVVIRGYDLVVEMINSSNLTYWKKTKEEVLGKPFLQILPDLADQPFASQLRRVMANGEIIDVKESPVRFTSPDGSIRETYVDYTYQPLSDLEGNRTGVLVMSSEITERVLSRRLFEKYADDLALANAKLLASNDELALSEARFKYLIQEAPVAIGVLHQRDLIIESANEKILEVWGKTPEIVGLPLSVALPELQGQRFLDILDEVFTSGKVFYASEIRSLLEHDGELKEYFFNVTYQPIADSSGVTADIMVVAADVTQQVNSRRQAERSEQHFRLLADLVPAKISNALPSGEVTFFNRQWLEFSGMGFEDLRDFGYYEMMHPEEIPVFCSGLTEAAAKGLPYISEMRFKDKKGKYVWHLNIASPVLDDEGKITMWVGSTTDIQSLKAEEQRKSDFVSMLSHELKTPLTSIKGHVQLLLRVVEKESTSPLTTRLGPALIRINQLLLQLTGLIADMLDMTRIEAGRLDLKKEPLLLDVLINDVVEDFRISHQQYHLNLNLEDGIEINADRHKISQVLINLIDNAMKYAPNTSTIDINLLSDGNEAQIQVRDYGIGIDEKDQKKIFNRFYRVEGQNEYQYSGFGIGLYLANSIVHFHGGIISLESIKGEGSVFTIHLPRR